MRFIVNSMDYVVDELLDWWDNFKEACTELGKIVIAIANALILFIFLLTIPIWIIPYLLYCRHNGRGDDQ